MKQALAFCDVVEAADKLSTEEQEALVQILSRRVAEQGRERLIAEVAEARREFKAGKCKPTTVAKLMKEIRK